MNDIRILGKYLLKKIQKSGADCRSTCTALIGKAANRVGAWVIFVSTEYVFDGRNPPYSPSDQRNPVNVYAKTKSEGEDELLKVLTSLIALLHVIFYLWQDLVQRRGRALQGVYSAHCLFSFQP